jgi:hypothetical protein
MIKPQNSTESTKNTTPPLEADRSPTDSLQSPSLQPTQGTTYDSDESQQGLTGYHQPRAVTKTSTGPPVSKAKHGGRTIADRLPCGSRGKRRIFGIANP